MQQNLSFRIRRMLRLDSLSLRKRTEKVTAVGGHAPGAYTCLKIQDKIDSEPPYYVIIMSRTLKGQGETSMAKNRKRRKPKSNPPPRSNKDRIYNRKRSFSEKAIIVLGIFIAISMVLSLFAFNMGGGF